MEQKGAPAYIAELLGTFVLVVFIGLVVSISSKGGLGYTDWAVIGLVHAFVLALLVAALAGASGAHFNPAVTTTLLALKKIRGADAGIYILMQLAGATLAALFVKGLVLDEGRPVNWGATLLGKSFLQDNKFAGFAAEGIGTFALLLAICGAAVVVRNRSDITAWVIGGALGMAVMCIGPLTGAGLNPARAFGPMLVAGVLDNNFGTFLIVYTLGPIIGGLIAGLAIRFIYSNDLEEAEGIVPPREDVIEIETDTPPGAPA